MTIYDIAREAGVSASTVSRVLNGKKGISGRTRARIMALVDKYNFTPDAAARALVTQSSRIIGILMADIGVYHHIDNAVLIEKEMHKRGYVCFTMSTGLSYEDQDKYMRILEEHRVEAVILMGSFFMTDAVARAVQQHLSNIPILIINGYLPLPNVTGIIIDENHGMQEATELLIQKGRRNFVYVNDRLTVSNLNKKRGFHEAMRRHNLKPLEVYDTDDATFEGGYRVTRELLARYPQVDAILYSVDMTAVGGIKAAQDMHRRIPEEISVIGCDNSVVGLISTPRLTTINNLPEELTEKVAETVSAMLPEGEHNAAPQGKRILIPSHLIMRESC